MDIEAGAPVILVPHSSRTSDILVLDMGTLTVKNSFLVDGDEGTIGCNKGVTASASSSVPTTPAAPATALDLASGLPSTSSG